MGFARDMIKEASLSVKQPFVFGQCPDKMPREVHDALCPNYDSMERHRFLLQSIARGDLDLKAPISHFNQKDHVRYYGRSFRDRIKSAGFELSELGASPEDCRRYGLMRGEIIFIGTKPGKYSKPSIALRSK